MNDKKEYIKRIVEKWIDDDIKDREILGLMKDQTKFETRELISLIGKIAIDISPFIHYISECCLNHAFDFPEHYDEKTRDYLEDNFQALLEKDYYLFREIVCSDYTFSKETLDWAEHTDEIEYFKRDLGRLFVGWE